MIRMAHLLGFCAGTAACNLATLNLLRFLEGSEFDIDGFTAAGELLVLAQDAIVEGSGYPSPEIERNAHRLRQIGIGYANLAALLLSLEIGAYHRHRLPRGADARQVDSRAAALLEDEPLVCVPLEQVRDRVLGLEDEAGRRQRTIGEPFSQTGVANVAC